MTRVPLEFNLDQWRTAAFGGERVKVLMKAKYITQQEKRSETPLLVKFGFDKGTVIFTSFHNAAQNSELERKLLQYLVFTAVTVQVEAELLKHMIAAGFVPLETRRLGVSSGGAVPSVCTTGQLPSLTGTE